MQQNDQSQIFTHVLVHDPGMGQLLARFLNEKAGEFAKGVCLALQKVQRLQDHRYLPHLLQWQWTLVLRLNLTLYIPQEGLMCSTGKNFFKKSTLRHSVDLPITLKLLPSFSN